MRLLLCAAIVLAACSDATAPLGVKPAYGVVITMDVPGTCLAGGCDPPGAGMTLSLIHVVNTGTSTAYLRACGTYAALTEQVVQNGAWVNAGPAIDCAVTPGPIVLAAGDSLRQNWWFASGTRQIVVGVSSKADLSDEALDASAGVKIK